MKRSAHETIKKIVKMLTSVGLSKLRPLYVDTYVIVHPRIDLWRLGTLSYFLIKRARKIRNISFNCAHICLKITKITINSRSKFSCERPCYVIYVIVIINWQIWCGFFIVNRLVLRENRTRCLGPNEDAVNKCPILAFFC